MRFHFFFIFLISVRNLQPLLLQSYEPDPLSTTDFSSVGLKFLERNKIKVMQINISMRILSYGDR